MGDSVTGEDPMESARYMAEISNRMQVPDRIMVSGDEQAGIVPSPSRGAGEGKFNDLGMRQRDPRIDMQVIGIRWHHDKCNVWNINCIPEVLNLIEHEILGARQDHGGRR